MRLDVSYLHFITKEELRTLISIQLGMRNHQYVPYVVILRIGNLKGGQTFKVVRKLLKNKLVVHVGGKNDGYKLTYLGYDYLALHTFLKRGVLKDVICKIGVGKQSDIYKCEDNNGNHIVMKLTRLGRRSFRTIKNNRQYIQNRTNYNWLYLSRLSSIRQFTFMQVLHQNGFPTPRPIDTNRHAILMSLVDGDPLCHIKRIGYNCSVKSIFEQSLRLVVKFAQYGLIHGDFNEFNLMISDVGKLTVIDFPQCISSLHMNGKQYFERDVQCLYRFFDKMMMKITKQSKQGMLLDESEQAIHPNDVGFRVQQVNMPIFEQIQIVKKLDNQINRLGHIKLSQEKQLREYQDQIKNINEQQQQGKKQQNQQEQQEQEQQQSSESSQQMEQKQQSQQQQLGIQHIKIDKQNPYEVQLKKLMSQLQQAQIPSITNTNTKQQPQPLQQEQEQDEQGQQQLQQGMRQQWKGLTAYQIRQIVKKQKKEERQKKKQELSSQQYIKKALRKGKKEFVHFSKGNQGMKKKKMQKTQSIKDGLQLGY